MEILIVTGLSGAGKTQATHYLEDLNYYCVDNIPADLIVSFADFCLASQGRFEKLAIVTDIRAQKSFGTLQKAVSALQERDCLCRVLYMEAPRDVIVRRYKETRRKHPLSASGLTVEEAIDKEIQLLEPMRLQADFILDTGSLTLGQLHKRICGYFAEGGVEATPITVMAFGYKYGLPLEADLVFDVRFLPNPYYVEELKKLSGMDEAVYNFVLGQKDAQEFLQRLISMMKFLLPRYKEEGKQSLTIAVGCTGGRHRSISVARALNDALLADGENSRLVCRDLHR